CNVYMSDIIKLVYLLNYVYSMVGYVMRRLTGVLCGMRIEVWFICWDVDGLVLPYLFYVRRAVFAVSIQAGTQ
ncbi:hypothetical protein PV939_10100, partial [Ligilactobacillus salivarius]|nr:hypothetical protein [Ligilactobacillus salivarius]